MARTSQIWQPPFCLALSALTGILYALVPSHKKLALGISAVVQVQNEVTEILEDSFGREGSGAQSTSQ